ncbi:ABC transporter ATP-binding protein/permease [Alphaproteobacteria bacterium]|nr:ABC transporter ATP-binding protein/permease [Alphaproteobacteria bacterium]
MINNLKKLLNLRNYISGHLKFIIKLKALNKNQAYLALALGTFALIFEGLGVSILVPLLSYIQVDGEISKFKESSLLSLYLYNFLNFLGLKVNMTMLSLIAVFFIFLRQLLNYFNLVLIQKICSRIHKKLNLEMFKSLMKTSQKFMTELNSGKFINATDIEPSMIAMTMKSYFTFHTNILTMVIYITVLLLTAFIPTLLGVFAMIFVVFITGSKVAIRTKRLSENLVNLRAQYRDLVTERYLGWKTIKTFNTVENEKLKLQDIQNNIYNLTVKITKISGLTQLIFVTIATTLILSTLNILIINLNFEATKILVFGIAFMRLTPTFKVFQHNINRLVELLPSYTFCENLYENSKKLSIKDHGKISSINLKNEISMRGLYFKYKNDKKYILENININIKVGKINAIIGSSGSGKSTLVDLLSKIIIPNKGKIFFDSTEIKDIKDKTLRKLITYIPQDPFLFKDNIYNNITYGAGTVSKKEIMDTLSLVKMDKFVNSLPKKLNTNVGMLGQSISGGQRQRLILARAILKKSEIFILDEATSAVDATTDKLIQKSLKLIKSKNKKITIIFISHRLSSLLFANHIIEIQNGKIKYQGNARNYSKGL